MTATFFLFFNFPNDMPICRYGRGLFRVKSVGGIALGVVLAVAGLHAGSDGDGAGRAAFALADVVGVVRVASGVDDAIEDVDGAAGIAFTRSDARTVFASNSRDGASGVDGDVAV